MLSNASISPEYIFNKHCSGTVLTRNEFKSLTRQFIEKLADFEVDSLYNRMDIRGHGGVSKEAFIHWFGQSEQEKTS